MRVSRWMKPVLLAAGALIAQGCTTTGNDNIAGNNTTEDGLVPLNVDTFEFVAVHPGADLATFTKVFIAPVELEFKQGWRPTTTGSRLGASQADLQEAGDDLESLFMQEFSNGLSSNPRLEIVDEAAPRVLRITPRLTDVTVNNLGGGANAGQSMSRKHGEVRLELAIHDVRTGVLVAKVADKRVLANRTETFSVSGANVAQTHFQRVFNGWGEFIGQAILNISPEAP